jgi:transposase-like protein
MASILSAPYFHNEEAAYEFVEERIWPDGPVCPHCGGSERVGKLSGKSTRVGTYKCYECRKPFTVKIGTIFESSHVKLHLWLQAIFLVASSKKGISSHQLHRTLGVTLKTAWFMSHRIREAMRSNETVPLGTGGGAVEADETFIGRDYERKPKGMKKGRGFHHKFKILSLIDRETGQARSIVIDDLKAGTIGAHIRENLDREARLMTDEASYYTAVGKEYAEHGIVRHGDDEYVRGDIYTNTAEGYFSIFKRGMKGVYQHCGHDHLHRYVAEFDFRYNNRAKLGIDDEARAEALLMGIIGKRLTYETTC